MKILYVASEALPFMASGGLAEVAGSLPKAIRDRQTACRVVMPLYGDIPQELREKMKYLTNFTVRLSWRHQYCGVFEATINGVIYYLLDNEYYFKRSPIYGFFDDAERFAFFAKAAVELIDHIDYRPDILHCNDWQTAMSIVYLNEEYRKYEKYKNIRTVFTVHNVQYQGRYGMEILQDVLGLPPEREKDMEWDGCLNMMKAAVMQADAVTTVSPTYAAELEDPWFSHGLDRLFRMNHHKVQGILNGIDTHSYDPQTDPEIFCNYSAKEPQGKAKNKAELQKLMGLDAEPRRPLIGMVSRLVSHKGMDLVKYILNEVVQDGFSVVVLGTGDYIYEEFFREMQMRYPGKVAVKIGFLPHLSRKIYAGSDLFLMPSKSEPCGLAQMVALRYGTIPVVRETGGLKDSIRDLGGEDGNGFTFQTYNAHDMFHALRRAKALYEDEEAWNRAVVHAMGCDFSWGRSAREYIQMYQSLLPQ